MFLVAIAIGFLVLGALIGRELSRGAAVACSLGAFGMLLVQGFGGARFRVGSFAIGWLFAVAFASDLDSALSSPITRRPTPARSRRRQERPR
jgi:hypothetical protein